MKYKVGDKVRVLPNLTRGRVDECNITSEMERYSGKETTITQVIEIDKRYKLALDNAFWNWTDGMLEPIGNYAIINGERIELTADQLRALGYEVKPKFDIELHNELAGLLWQFAIDNGGIPELSTCNFYIHELNDGLYASSWSVRTPICQPRFCSQEAAQRAIDEIVKPFLEKHPDFRW